MTETPTTQAGTPAPAPETIRPAKNELTARRRPLHALTGIRFFAAYFVVLFHSRLAGICNEHHLSALGYFFGNGFLAVPLFFLLSGFILSYTYNGQIERRGDHRRFWEARFARIWPVYVASLLLASLPELRVPTWPVVLACLTMLQAWNPFDISMAGSWNPVCWTLSVEALFYVVFPFVQVWLERRHPRWQLGWIGAMLACAVALNSGARTFGYPAEGVFRFVPFPLVHLPEFFVGVGLGNYFLEALAAQRALQAAGTSGARSALLPCGGLWTYGSAALGTALLCLPPGRWTSVVIVAFAALVYGLAAESTALSRSLSTPLLLLGGGISYSVYLLQMPVKHWVALLFDHLHSDATFARLAANLVLLTLLSLILFQGVENPARKLLRSFFAGLEQRRLQAPPR